MFAVCCGLVLQRIGKLLNILFVCSSLFICLFVCIRSVIIPNLLGPDTVSSGGEYNGRKYWPGFRVVKVMTEYGISFLKTNILEPGFYWRVQHDYATYPDPEVVTYNNAVENSLNEIKKRILLLSSQNRVVIHGSTCADARCIEATKRWAVSVLKYIKNEV